MNCLTSESVIENSIHKFSPASGREVPQNQKCKDVEEIAALFGNSLNDDKENRMSELEKLITDNNADSLTQECTACIREKAEIIVKCASNLHMKMSELTHAMCLLRKACYMAEEITSERARF